jgi:crotonobetainyl-CoA:carnitine CoA-transferase CaiB-like acyl-CoA transferase
VVSDSPRTIASQLWDHLGGEPGAIDSIQFTGPAAVLPSFYDVTGLATAAVGVATLAAATVASARTGSARPEVSVDSLHAAAAYLGERLLAPAGWELGRLWEPIAGDYQAADGWIRLHTNYEYHRRAALQVLRVDPDGARVAEAVRSWPAEALQEAIVGEGGCAAAMHDAAAWTSHRHGRHAILEPAVAIDVRAGGAPTVLEGASRPLAGVRVLDLTRVIAGPVCTGFLAAHGAEVLRIDPPGFVEVPALVPYVTAGKRCASLDLRSNSGRAIFEGLVSEADVLVHGLRPGALAGLGFPSEVLDRLRPGLIVAALDAYGWTGPWAGRRGYDSLVQMSCGAAAAGGDDRPRPLPAQALDHTSGYLLASAVCLGLSARIRGRSRLSARVSLVGVANVLMSRPRLTLDLGPPEWPDSIFEEASTEWGAIRRVRCPGRIAGSEPSWSIPPGPLGRHPAAW